MKWLLRNWEYKLTVLFVGIFLLQYVEWFGYYWLPETKRLVVIAIISVLVIETAFSGIRPYWRKALQLAVIALAHAVILHYEPVGGSVRTFGKLMSVIEKNWVQFTPYIWFSLAAWAIYFGTLRWVEKKWRIFALIVVSVIAFSIFDSFSRHYMWQQVAVLIFSGLSLLVIHHFVGLKKKNPVVWSYLADYPGSIAAVVLVPIAIVMIAGLIAPDVRPLMTDPYTAWKTWRGEAVVTAGKGKSNLIQIGSGDSSSGYGRNDAELGGGFNYDYSPVMQITTTQRSYWRGETRTHYNGKGWEPMEGEEDAAGTAVVLNEALPYDAAENHSKAKTVEVKQTVTLLAKQSFPVLFGAYAISRLEQAETGEGPGASQAGWIASRAELRWNDRSGDHYPRTYTIVSRVPVTDEAALRSVSNEALQNDGKWSPYLQLPDTVPARVRELAREISGDAGTPYDKVKRIEQYLRENYPYTNKPDLSKGRSEDFVDRFLFEIKEGYCDYFSTAMVVLVRSVGIPARWVKGYLPGMQPAEEIPYDVARRLEDTQGAGTYTVRNADAHSWVEVYFDGWGWIPFEPTAGFSLPVVRPQNEAETAPAATENGAVESEQTDTLLAVRVLVPVTAAAAVVALIWFVAAKYRLLPSAGRLRQQSSDRTRRRIVVAEFEKLLRKAKRKGFLRQEHETVRETATRWIGQNRWLQKDMDTLLEIFEKAKYSRADVTDEDVHTVIRKVRKLREEM